MAANVGHLLFATPLKGKTIRKGETGRVCRSEGCSTVLSIYNEFEDCSLHAVRTLKPPRHRS